MQYNILPLFFTPPYNGNFQDFAKEQVTVTLITRFKEVTVVSRSMLIVLAPAKTGIASVSVEKDADTDILCSKIIESASFRKKAQLEIYIVLVVVDLSIKSDPGNRKNLVGIKKVDTVFSRTKRGTVNPGSCFRLQP